MASNDIYEYSHTPELVRIENKTPLSTYAQMILNMYHIKRTTQLPILINMQMQDWAPPNYNIGDEINYWCSGTCYIFNSGFLANSIFAVFNLYTYDTNVSNYRSRIFYGTKSDLSDLAIYWN